MLSPDRTRTTLCALAMTTALLTPAAAGASGLTPVIGGFYVGGGVLYTEFDELPEDDHIGYRLYGGFDLLRIPLIMRVGLEGGHVRTGSYFTSRGTDRFANSDVGLQLTLTTIPLLNLHVRAGYEWGDSDGDYYALGGTLGVSQLVRIRGEYQFRNEFEAALLGIELRFP